MDETLWAQLKKDFENAFAHTGRVEQARMELQKHCMDGDLIDEYITKFETLLSKGNIPQTKVGAIKKFKDGLKPGVLKGILIRDTWPTNIDKWEEVARHEVCCFGIMKEALERQGQSFGKPSKWQTDAHKFLSKKKNEPVPMEVDATTTQEKKPFKQGFNDNLKKEGQCFQCHKQGHMKKDCLDKAKAPAFRRKPKIKGRKASTEDGDNETLDLAR